MLIVLEPPPKAILVIEFKGGLNTPPSHLHVYLNQNNPDIILTLQKHEVMG